MLKTILSSVINSGITPSLPEERAATVRTLNVTLLLLCGVSIISAIGWWGSVGYFNIKLSFVDFGIISLFLASIYVILIFLNGLKFYDLARGVMIVVSVIHYTSANLLMGDQANESIWIVACIAGPVLVIPNERGWFISAYIVYFVMFISVEIWKSYFPVVGQSLDVLQIARYCNILVLAGAVTLLIQYYRNAASRARFEREEMLKSMFGKFLDPRIVTDLLGEGEAEIDRAERRVVTVFFSDIRGFTEISEQLTAATIVRFLNHYFDAATHCIRVNNGILDKYIGDSIMAFWSSPFSPGDSHAPAACLAALAQQDAIDVLRRELPEIIGLRRNAPNLFVRMGIATGEVVMGAVGSTASMSFTVIGDTVNLASRLESINKEYGTRVIVAEETLRLAQNEVEARELDLITVAGKTEPVRIYELLCPFGMLTSADTERRDEFAAGLAAYRSRAWEEAQCRFKRCLQLKPTDGPAATFLDRVGHFRADPPPENWDGVWRFLQK